MTYRIFDRTLGSNIKLPELRPAHRSEADCSFRLKTTQFQEQDTHWFHSWTRPEEKNPWLLFGRRSSSFVLRFPDGVDFVLSANGRTIEGFPTPHVSRESIRNFLLSQVIPLTHALLGQFVVHACSVLGPQGKALVITGGSGSGKSTLAGYLAQSGYPLLADDILLLTDQEEQISMIPGYPGSPSSDENPAVPLGHVYILAETKGKIEITPLRPSLAFIKIARQTFSLPIQDVALIKNNFQRLTRLVEAQVAFQLAFPSDLGFLPKVCEAVLQHADDVLRMNTKA